MITEDSLQLHGLFNKILSAWWPAFALEDNINSSCYYEEDTLTLQGNNAHLKIPENYRQNNFAQICPIYLYKMENLRELVRKNLHAYERT